MSDGPSVRELETLEELEQVDGLFQWIWGATGSQVAMPVNLLRALVHSGNYVSGAYAGSRLVGAAVGWMGEHRGERELHSHVVGVARDCQGRGVGLAVKLHQRAWALSRGIPRVVWTFDPLTRRNGWFNLAKLGARAVAYHPNFYGRMFDDLNGSDDTDRCLVRWDVDGAGPTLGPATVATGIPSGYACLLSARDGPAPEPLVSRTAPIPGEGRVACQVPPDIVGIRRADEGLARRWRSALRATMGAAMGSGCAATAMTSDGYYLLEPGRGQRP